MSDTMINMDNYTFIDELRPDQLMEGDLIEFADDTISEIGRVISIESIYENKEYSYIIQGKNDFAETLEIVVNDSVMIKLFIEN